MCETLLSAIHKLINYIWNKEELTGEKWEYNETVHQLFLDFKKPYDSVRREILYNILIDFVVSMKLVRPNKI
jgi:hypothetical protein